MKLQYQNKSLEVAPSQNDLDSGPRKSRKFDLTRRAQVKKHRNNARDAVNINVSVVESMLLGNSGRRIFCGCLLIRIASCKPRQRGPGYADGGDKRVPTQQVHRASFKSVGDYRGLPISYISKPAVVSR